MSAGLTAVKFKMDVILDTLKINTEKKSATKKKHVHCGKADSSRNDCKTWCSALTFSHGRYVLTIGALEESAKCNTSSLETCWTYMNSTTTSFSKNWRKMNTCLMRLDAALSHGLKFQLYVDYCKNHPRSSKLNMVHSLNYFDKIQQKPQLPNMINSYLVKPVLRILRYPVLVKATTFSECAIHQTILWIHTGSQK
ncbi:uncharacterized protein LOC144066889 isoform X3 [Stigmatopora argus]